MRFPSTARLSANMSSAASATNPDPRKEGPQPPFKGKPQDWPGFEGQMDPKPDWGQDSYKGSDKLRGRVALITGGDSGIGRAVAIAFGREGAHVAISYLPQEQQDAEDCKSMVEKSGTRCLLIPGDLNNKEYCAEIVQKTIDTFGKLDILVNNAATQGKSVPSMVDMEYERVMTTFRVNIVGMFEVTKHALKHLKPGGVILNTGSIQAYSPTNSILDYACTKAAIVAFTKGLSDEQLPKGIRVNCVAPGPIWTPLVAASFDQKKLSEFGSKVPMKRPGQPAELAPAYVFLASNNASYVSGEILAVTGGGITM